MIRRLPPVRVPDAANEALEEGPLIVGYQVARQDHLPRRDELEAQVADQQNPFCQHDLGCVNAKRFIVEESGADRFVALFVEKAAALKIGDPMERDTSIGPMARGNPQAVWAAPSTNVQLEKRIVLNVALQPHRPK